MSTKNAAPHDRARRVEALAQRMVNLAQQAPGIFSQNDTDMAAELIRLRRCLYALRDQCKQGFGVTADLIDSILDPLNQEAAK